MQPACPNPVLIVGTERSGSNLLRLILDAHPSIAIPHPPHVMRYFAPIAASYGDLADDGNLRRLARDVVRLVRLHIHPWDIRIDLERLVREARPRSLLGLYIGLHEQHRERSGKPRWGCKSTFMIDHVEEVRDALPGARFLHLVRDPRDVAASSRTAVFNPYHPYFTATLWRRQQEQALLLRESLPAGVMTTVAFERLVAHPEETLREVCGFLDEPYDGRMLRWFETPAARAAARLSESWRNTALPLQGDRSGRYLRDLSPPDALLVEAVAREPMRLFGYGTGHSDADLDLVPVRRPTASFFLGDLALRLRAEARSLRRDRNFFRRWARDGFVTYLRGRARLRRIAPW